MAVNLQGVAELLQASLNPKQQKQAEAAIRDEEKKPGFSLSLLEIVSSQAFPNTSRLASALYFKNYIKRNWIDDDGNHLLPQADISAIKRELVGLMITVPPPIQAQLGDAISVIADSDFWEQWDTLVDDLIARLTPDNAIINNGVIQVAHSIFKRWRPLFRSDLLYTEINHVLSKFSQPFLSLLQSTDSTIQHNETNQVQLHQYFETLTISIKLLYDLSVQELPPTFEEHLQSLSSLLNRYLRYDNKLLHTEDTSESGPLEFVKAGIFEILSLWVQKYEEDLRPYIGQFVETSWTLLTNVGPEIKYDILTSRALNFLSSIGALGQHAEIFNNEDTLAQVIEKVILPNLSLRESDVELFQEEPIEFTRRDLEGTDSDTRRRAATDFLRQLMQQFQELVTTVVTRYIDHYLQEYSTDRTSNWKSKDTAVYLFCSIAAVGSVTSGQGVKSTNPFVNIIDFFQKNIAQDLISESSHVLLQVDAIKYLYIFRSQLNQQQWQEAFPLLVQHLGSSNYVVHTYSAIALERILYLTDEKHEPIIPRATVVLLSRDLLQRLFLLITKETAPEKVQENEFLPRAVMRVLIAIREDAVPITDLLLTNFINILRVIQHNPSNPRFYYYLFEGIGALIRFAAPSQPDKLESSLYESFLHILQNDVQEFIPYIFQLFAALLEANSSGALPYYFKNLIQPVLMPVLWESKGNTPALVRLLTSLVSRGAGEISSSNQIEPILGVFQKLISSKSSDVYGFDLLESIISAFPPTSLEKYFPTILTILLTRLSGSRTEQFALRFVSLYHFMSARDAEGLGVDAVVNIIEQVQPGVYTGLYLNIILPETQKLVRPLDRKVAVISLTKTLASSELFAEKYKEKGWGFTCEALLRLMLDPPVPTKDEDMIVEQDVEDVSFGVGFTQLNTCRRVLKDPYPEIRDVKTWIGQCLKEANDRHGGRINTLIERLSPETQQILVAYMQG